MRVEDCSRCASRSPLSVADSSLERSKYAAPPKKSTATMMSFARTGSSVNRPPAPTAMPIWVMKASEAPVTIEDERERVLITIVAIIVLSGNSSKNITAKMPKNAPTFMGRLELLTNYFGKGQTDPHALEVLGSGRRVSAHDRVRIVKGLDLVGEGRVAHVRGGAGRHARHVLSGHFRQRLVPVLGHVAPDRGTRRHIHQQQGKGERYVLAAELAEVALDGVDRHIEIPEP